MKPLKSGNLRGFTLLETFIALSIFSGIMVITTLLLKQSVWVWTSGDSRGSAGLVLRKARTALVRDLIRADLDPGPSGEPHISQTQVPAALGGGDAIWFLSAAGPNNGFVRDSDGYPFWQRNVLYYLAKPQNHDLLYSTTCQASPNPQGDDYCPHKMLIRVVIDNPPVTVPLPPAGTPPPAGTLPEELISNSAIAGYLLAPQGLDVSAIQALPGVEDVQIVSTGLLWFKVDPAPSSPATGRQVDLRAVAINEATKQISLGATALFNHPTTLTNVFSLFPKN